MTLGTCCRDVPLRFTRHEGVAFRTVVIPVVPSRLLDRAMPYTAVTRGRESWG